MKQLLLILLLLMSVIHANAQEADIWDFVDRPGTGSGPEVVTKGKLVWETGMGYEYSKIDDDKVDAFTLNSSVLRYGLTRNADVFMQMDLYHVKSMGEKTTGFGPLGIGTKVNVYEGDEVLPMVSFMAVVTLPTGKEEFTVDEAAPEFHALFSQNLPEPWGLAYDLGLQWDGSDTKPQTFVSAFLSYDVTSNLGLFVESFNTFKKHNSPDYNLDFGAYWRLSRRIQVDASGVLGLSSPGDYYGVSVGLAWLLN